MTPPLRIFFAIDPPPAARDRLAAVQDDLRACGADVKWVRPENLHLTLRFFADLNPKRLRHILAGFDDFFTDRPRFDAVISGLGAFPRVERPIVIWAGIDGGEDLIRDTAARLDAGLNRAGLRKNPERFAAHITLGRIRRRDARTDGLVRRLQTLRIAEPVPFPVERVILYRSTLTGDGPVYEKLAESCLGKR